MGGWERKPGVRFRRLETHGRRGLGVATILGAPRTRTGSLFIPGRSGALRRGLRPREQDRLDDLADLLDHRVCPIQVGLSSHDEQGMIELVNVEHARSRGGGRQQAGVEVDEVYEPDVDRVAEIISGPHRTSGLSLPVIEEAWITACVLANDQRYVLRG